nr:hypothetical protein [Kibdelosporangium sp. MJ126-NF4]CTQ96257.1 hypothetical protein [Kibdelosporangium sp. MJ126-NF4]
MTRSGVSYAACSQVGQLQSEQVQFAQESEHELHEHAAWLHVGQAQSEQEQTAHESEQCGQVQLSHSS